MGNGKGNPEYWVADPAGQSAARDGRRWMKPWREAFRLAAAKLPIETVFVTRMVG